MTLPLFFMVVAAAGLPGVSTPAPIISTTPQDTLNIGQIITWTLSLIAIGGTVWVAFFNKKASSPADELARADFAYTKIKERLAEVDGDRKYLTETNTALREALARADADANASMEEKRKLRALIEQGDQRIHDLEEQNRILNERLDKIADKVKNGLAITLRDVYGETVPRDPHSDLGDTEMTKPREGVA